MRQVCTGNFDGSAATPGAMELDAVDATVSADPDAPPDPVPASELTGMLTVSWFATLVVPASGVPGPSASRRFAVACQNRACKGASKNFSAE